MSKISPPVPTTPPLEELPTSRQLLRSTAIAAAVALLLLMIAVLPAEYGIDPTGIGRLLGLTQMGELKTQLAKEAAAHRPGGELPDPAPSVASASGAPAAPSRSDVTKVTLGPNESTEVKLAMSGGAKVTFQWSVAGGQVSYDLHSERPDGAYHGYGDGEGSQAEKGELVAAFDGWHGWHWRNKASGDVTITLETKGDYRDVKEMK